VYINEDIYGDAMIEDMMDLIHVDSDDEETLALFSKWLIEKADILPSLTRYI
jgi:hypothetical protein